MTREKRVYNTSQALSRRVANAVKWMAEVTGKNQKEVSERILWRAYLRLRRKLAANDND